MYPPLSSGISYSNTHSSKMLAILNIIIKEKELFFFIFRSL
ncbi:hypothetical protein HMPREF0083_05768 [Aneurinibacillus aneurinilyticus ATCC 12856]|uniref:Uncharacterized protein n=1 Tax=Aneurinibacillus aneurinilyticus ATCC 12856 TaxID=649747 RepID=U1WRC9_ANEAE|nr:hypothetical protein HMPREF0083_05768 [Aneurinibacillus aneurinilyticus ATCC 12856]